MATPTDTRPGIVHAEVDATLTTRKKIVADEHESVPVNAGIPASPIRAEIEVAVGVTIGLPNYSAARFDVKLRLPCRPDPASVEATYAAALRFCNGKLDELKATVA